MPQYESIYGQDARSIVDLANMFGAGMLLAIAAHVATGPGESLDGTHLARALTRLSDTSRPPLPLTPPGFADIISELDARREVNIEGASGKLDFDPKVGEAKADIEVWEISGREFKTVAVGSP